MIVTGQVDCVATVRLLLPDYRTRVKIVHRHDEINYEEQLKRFIEEIVQKATDVQGIVKDLNGNPRITLADSPTSLSNSTTDLCSTTTSDTHLTCSTSDRPSTNICQPHCELAVYVLRVGEDIDASEESN